MGRGWRRKRIKRTRKSLQTPTTWAKRLQSWNYRLKKRGSTTVLTANWLTDYLKVVGSVCNYCWVRLTPQNAGLDHIQPTFKGGTDSAWNLQIICQDDNRAKSVLSHKAYSAMMFSLLEFPDDLELVQRKLRSAWGIVS